MRKLGILQCSDLKVLAYKKENEPHCERAQDVEKRSRWLFDQVNMSCETRDH